MGRMQVQLTKEQVETLRRMAARTKVSMAELVRRGVAMLVASEHEPGADEKRAKARDATGGFRSGHSDVSERHDDQFAEALLEEQE